MQASWNGHDTWSTQDFEDRLGQDERKKMAMAAPSGENGDDDQTVSVGRVLTVGQSMGNLWQNIFEVGEQLRGGGGTGNAPHVVVNAGDWLALSDKGVRLFEVGEQLRGGGGTGNAPRVVVNAGDWLALSDEGLRQLVAELIAYEELRQLVAELIAYRIVENTNHYRKRHFFVLNKHRKPVPFDVHWQYKNAVGVSYKSRQAAAARQWVCAALLAGFTVFYSSRKQGRGADRSLATGVYSEDALRLYRELQARGIAWNEMQPR
jgi:hypothetical protein